MRLNDKTCRLCLAEAEYGQKMDDILQKSRTDTVVQALKEVFGWEVKGNLSELSITKIIFNNSQQVKKSDPLTKICMECKASLLDVYIYVRNAKTNDKKWRKVWLQSTIDIDEISSDEEQVQVKQEPVDVDIGQTTFRPVLQYVKEEGETSDSDFEEKELMIDDVGPMVTSTTVENNTSSEAINVKKETTDTPKRKSNGPNLRKREITIPTLEWSTTDESSDSEVEEVSIEKSKEIEIAQVPRAIEFNKKLKDPTPPLLPTTTTSTLTCSEEIEKKGFKSIAEKMLTIKKDPNLTDDQMCKIFYGLNCKLCENLEFEKLNDLESHYKEKHSVERISVKCCNIDIVKPIMVDHIKYHLGMMKSSLKDHIRRLTTSKICEECGLLFSSEKLLKHHVRAHMSLPTTSRTRSLSLDGISAKIFNMTTGQFASPKYPCPICERPFEYECYMKQHIVKHMSFEEQQQYKKFECHDCSSKFFYKTDLQKHIEKVHLKFRRRTSGKAVCLQCNKVLSSLSHLICHQSKHWSADERRRNMSYHCSICSKSFWFKSGMKKHEQTHLGKPSISTTKVYKCLQCDKAFNVKPNYEKHLLSHMTKEQRYENMKFECPKCPRRFWKKFEFEDHISFVHDKNYKYVCDVCKRPYAHKYGLKKHSCGSGMKVYVRGGTSDEKHECEFCGKIFNSPTKLKSHMYQWHLPGFMYECEVCSKGFNNHYTFDKHKKKCIVDTLAHAMQNNTF